MGVLAQRLGTEPQPVANLSKRLDPTAQGWPPCLQNLAAIAVLTEDALKLSFGAKYFYQPPSETTPEWERSFIDILSKDPQISSSTDGKSRPDYIPF